MKLQLEHYAFYLPHNVSVYGASEIWTLKGLNKEYKGGFTMNLDCGLNKTIGTPEEFIIVLRPLSDLTKEIEHNGEKFVPMEWFEKRVDQELIDWIYNELSNDWINNIKCFPYHMNEKLLEWHFDIHGLIKEGLAVDINTLGK